MTPAPVWTAAVIALTTMSLELLPVELKIRTENTGLVGEMPCIEPRRTGGDRRDLGAVPVLIGDLEAADDIVVRKDPPGELGHVRVDAGVEDRDRLRRAPPGSASVALVCVGDRRSGWASASSMQPVGACCAGRETRRWST